MTHCLPAIRFNALCPGLVDTSFNAGFESQMGGRVALEGHVADTIPMPVERVIQSLGRIIEWRVKPGTIRVDNGPEHSSGKLLIRAEARGIDIQHVQPDQPQQNSYIKLQLHRPT